MSNTRSIGTSFDSGVRVPNYTNGRTLHAEDLSADQSATRTRLAQLAQAGGYGIVEGLTVRQTPGSTNSLQVDPGIAITLHGDAIELASTSVTLSLVLAPEERDDIVAGNAGLFQPCDIATSGEDITIETGAYLLTVMPVSRLEGTTPLNSAAQRGNTFDCAAKWVVEGVEFKAIRLTDFGNNGVDAIGKPSTLRNRLAHWCLGSKALGIFPFAGYDGAYSGIDRISADDLTLCDVPLAVFYWVEGGVSFVDNWAARRRMARAYITPAWSGFFGEKRSAEGEARLLQFQEQLGTLLNAADTNPQTLRAVDHFAHLPPLGFLPALPPVDSDLLDYVSGRLLALILTGGTTTSETDSSFPAPDYWQEFWLSHKDELVAEIRSYVQQQNLPQQHINLPTFWGNLLPRHVRVGNLETIDVILQRVAYQDAITLARQPEIRLYYPEEYLLQFIGSLLDKMPTEFSADNMLEWVYLWARYLRNFTLEMPADEWLLHSLSTYLDMPQPVLAENMQRDDLVYVMFTKVLADPASFSVGEQPSPEPPEEDIDANETGEVAGGAGLVGSVADLNARLNRPNITPAEFTHELARAARPLARSRGSMRRRLARAARRRARR